VLVKAGAVAPQWIWRQSADWSSSVWIQPCRSLRRSPGCNSPVDGRFGPWLTTLLSSSSFEAFVCLLPLQLHHLTSRSVRKTSLKSMSAKTRLGRSACCCCACRFIIIRHSQNAWARHVERVVSCRDVTWRAKWNLGLSSWINSENSQKNYRAYSSLAAALSRVALYVLTQYIDRIA